MEVVGLLVPLVYIAAITVKGSLTVYDSGHLFRISSAGTPDDLKTDTEVARATLARIRS